MNELKTHLQDLVENAEWEWLQEHAQEGRLIIVGSNLELVEVGLALAADDITTVKQWLDDGWLYRPNSEQINYWQQQQDLEFPTLIIQPFVLSQIPNET